MAVISAAGVTWIGPPPEAIEVMGDKISSRLAAARAEVESVPGTTVPITAASEIVDFGAQYGYPIAILFAVSPFAAILSAPVSTWVTSPPAMSEAAAESAMTL